MKDFKKMIEEQIKKTKTAEEKTVAIELIDEQSVSDDEINNSYEKMEELYYKFFVDTTLVKIIENQIKTITCEEDMYKPFNVSINYYLYIVNTEMYDLYLKKNKKFSSVRGIAVSEPLIGETLDGISSKDVSGRDMYLVCNFLPEWILLHIKFLPFQLSFDTCNLSKKYDCDIEEYTTLSFTSSLQRLIDMYYAEKQREEDKNRLNNHSKKK